MKLHHIAIWTYKLEELRDFYTRYFNGKNQKYVNSAKGFESYFIAFDGETSLELMMPYRCTKPAHEENRLGLTHMAFTFGSREEVLRQTERLRADGMSLQASHELREMATLKGWFSILTATE